MLDLPTRIQGGVRNAEGAAAEEAGVSFVAGTPPRLGLAGRVLLVTIGFVLLAMGLLYVTRLAAHRENWLHNKLAAAQTAVEAFDASGPSELPADLSRRLLASVGVKSITIAAASGRRMLAVSGAPPAFAETVSLDNETFVDGVAAAFRTLFTKRGAIIQVVGSPQGGEAIAVTLDETPLVAGLWRLSHTFLNISLTIAAVLTCVLWAALWQMVLRPVRRLTSNIIAFGESPQDISRVIAPSGRHDDIGRAETALAAMQGSLAHELAQRKRLAELGMAVARINHDLRNMLTAAQLISDRLATIPDPLAQRLAPRLVATLDRAIQFCQATLTYGAAREQPPNRRPFDLNALVRQVVESGRAENEHAIEYQIDLPPRFEVYADPDQVLRVLENLSRNAAQALIAKGAAGERPRAIRFAAIRTDGVALIEISDTGPGFPPGQSERIFEPFHKSTNEAGAGLGLAIAADLVARNGGSITLAPAKADDFYCGACFHIRLPTPQRAVRKAARASVDDR
ncbi:MAG: HAMP domain-containing histidine kinase [Hyphomicrobiales bacterium]|nr:HAMP domain-containing histidine kinase [Hyphomicrobiales bacterium]